MLNFTTKNSPPIGPIASLAAAKFTNSPADAVIWTRLLDALAIGTLVVVAAIAGITFRDYGLGWDDYTHSQYGDLLVSLYGSGFADKRALSFVNLYMYGGGYDLLATLAAKVLPFDCLKRGDLSAPWSASLACWLPGGWAGGLAARSPA